MMINGKRGPKRYINHRQTDVTAKIIINVQNSHAYIYAQCFKHCVWQTRNKVAELRKRQTRAKAMQATRVACQPTTKY